MRSEGMIFSRGQRHLIAFTLIAIGGIIPVGVAMVLFPYIGLFGYIVPFVYGFFAPDIIFPFCYGKGSFKGYNE